MTEELAYHNEPLNLPLTYDWNKEGRPQYVYLPYSRLTLAWNSGLNKWEYKDPSSGSYSLNSHSSCGDANKNLPSSTESACESEVGDMGV